MLGSKSVELSLRIVMGDGESILVSGKRKRRSSWDEVVLMLKGVEWRNNAKIKECQLGLTKLQLVCLLASLL